MVTRTDDTNAYARAHVGHVLQVTYVTGMTPITQCLSCPEEEN